MCFPYLILIPEKVGPQLDTGTVFRASVCKVNRFLSPQSNDPETEVSTWTGMVLLLADRPVNVFSRPGLMQYLPDVRPFSANDSRPVLGRAINGQSTMLDILDYPVILKPREFPLQM